MFIAVLLSGCGGISKPTAFFMLSPMNVEDIQPLSVKDEISVLVGPITVPAYLDRKQIVVRQPGVQIAVYDFDHWAEPLSHNLRRVVVTNLSSLLASSEVYDIEQRNVPATDYQLSIDIQQFDTTAEGEAILLAFWALSDKEGQVLKRERSLMKAQSSSSDVQGYVTALNEITTKFSRKLAEEIVSLEAF